MSRVRTVRIGIAAAALALGVAAPVQAAPSCAAQFIRIVAPQAVPFGTTVVVPEIRDPQFGQTHLGEAVRELFARADRTACPVTP
jgi:hypothetical protein